MFCSWICPDMNLTLVTKQHNQAHSLFPVSVHGIKYTSNSDTGGRYTVYANGKNWFFFKGSKCENENYPDGASPHSFTHLNGCGMLPYSLTKGHSEFGLGTLSEWVVLKQLVCHSNLDTAAEIWMWSYLADCLPFWCGLPAMALVSLALRGCQNWRERSFILQTQWEKNTQVSAREAACVILRLYILHSCCCCAVKPFSVTGVLY